MLQMRQRRPQAAAKGSDNSFHGRCGGCALDEATLELLKFAMSDLNLSARAYDRVLKVARTIADLAATEKICSDHISEAIQFRSLDRQLWT